MRILVLLIPILAIGCSTKCPDGFCDPDKFYESLGHEVGSDKYNDRYDLDGDGYVSQQDFAGYLKVCGTD